MTANSTGLPCPTCGRATSAASSRFLPFCSDRCRLIDLGRWLDEQHSIPCTPGDDEEPEAEANRESGAEGEAGDRDVRPPVRLPPGWHDA